MAINKGLSIVYVKNHVKNIGFGKNSAHTKCPFNIRANMKVRNIGFPLNHPPL